MTTDAFQRARSPKHKAQRREAILAAATDAAARGGIRGVSLADIAAAVPIHKSALLRYFATREEIYLELGGRAWTEWAQATEGQLGALVRDDETGAAGVLAGGLARRPLLCDLIPHAALNLERHASLEAIRAYKLRSLGAVQRVADALAGPLPALDDPGRHELVSCAALLAGSMWQIATPPPPLAELYASDPELGHAIVDLEPQLTTRLHALIVGLAATGERN
jgi:AcrR family transcriptional regulator